MRFFLTHGIFNCILVGDIKMQKVLSVLEKFGNLFSAIHRKQIVQGPTECVDEFLWDVRVGYGLRRIG